jgi:hypothetical protein
MKLIIAARGRSTLIAPFEKLSQKRPKMKHGSITSSASPLNFETIEPRQKFITPRNVLSARSRKFFNSDSSEN